VRTQDDLHGRAAAAPVLARTAAVAAVFAVAALVLVLVLVAR
jgi:hypothetical protein